ncbi:hypothetical protein HYH03_006061 [Edaphochlamys debaryana]|uniref:Uncharacterized protein n=1 Tax=Edaphochlamys debaryana TaxID=47281 RepID=A0A836C0H0_9CHLO|nr:hypothetical protein HYH03_006061 [Edaphochlamys debaryana]|eukprot:KAG2495821.1 hypothetical protein HYH03_006061 [Edaphochlamys debaryana]
MSITAAGASTATATRSTEPRDLIKPSHARTRSTASGLGLNQVLGTPLTGTPLAGTPCGSPPGTPSRGASLLNNSAAAAEEDDADAFAQRPSFSQAPAPNLTLDVCPSFAEQTGGKPLWFERHNTFKALAHVRAVADEPTEEIDGSALEKPAALPAPEHVSTSGMAARYPYLPSWDICRSKVWLMVEASLMHMREAAAMEAAIQASSAVASPSTSALTSANATREPSAPQRSSTDSPLRNATPFATHHVQTPLALDEELQLLNQLLAKPSHGDPDNAPTSSSAASSHGGAAPSAGPGLGRVMTLGRHAAQPAPKGLGPLPLALTPSMSFLRARSMARLRGHTSDLGSHDAAHAGAGADAGASSGAPGGLQAAATERKPLGKSNLGSNPKHTAAFAAGIVVGTSAFAAVGNATQAAASAFAAVTTTVGAASNLVPVMVTAQAVNTAGDVLLNKWQGKAIKGASTAAADAVLGPAASEGLRSLLRQRLRATVAGMSVACFVLHVHSMQGALCSLDFEHDFEHSARLVLDLAASGPSVLENVRELLQIGIAVTLGMAQRSAGGGAGGPQ